MSAQAERGSLRSPGHPHVIRLAGPWELCLLRESIPVGWPRLSTSSLNLPTSDPAESSAEHPRQQAQPSFSGQPKGPPEPAIDSANQRWNQTQVESAAAGLMQPTHAFNSESSTARASTAAGSGDEQMFRVTIPDDWARHVGENFAGVARYLRRFGCPTNLQSGQRVELVIEPLPTAARVTLNDRLLTASEGAERIWRLDVTSLLAIRNQLLIDLAYPPSASGMSSSRESGIVDDAAAQTARGLRAAVRLEIWEAATGENAIRPSRQ